MVLLVLLELLEVLVPRGHLVLEVVQELQAPLVPRVLLVAQEHRGHQVAQVVMVLWGYPACRVVGAHLVQLELVVKMDNQMTSFHIKQTQMQHQVILVVVISSGTTLHKHQLQNLS